jgi:hypothetical protein
MAAAAVVVQPIDPLARILVGLVVVGQVMLVVPALTFLVLLGQPTQVVVAVEWWTTLFP